MSIAKEDLRTIQGVFEQVLGDMEERLFARMENAAKGIIRTEIEDHLYSELHRTIREVKREISVDVRLKDAAAK